MSDVPHVWVVLPVYVCALHRCLVPTGPKEGIRSPQIGVVKGCESRVLGLVLSFESSLQRCNNWLSNTDSEPNPWPTQSLALFPRFQHKFKVYHMKSHENPNLRGAVPPDHCPRMLLVTGIQWKAVHWMLPAARGLCHSFLSPPMGNPTGKTAKDLPVTWSTSSASVTRHSINLLAQVQIESAILLWNTCILGQSVNTEELKLGMMSQSYWHPN